MEIITTALLALTVAIFSPVAEAPASNAMTVTVTAQGISGSVL